MFNILELTSFKKIKIARLMFKNSYKTLSLDKDKNLGVARHYPPASKEWKDSVYSYNDEYKKNLPFKDDTVSTIIKNYLSLIPASKKTTKSMRMRMLIRRSSTKKLFVSKPEIKQTSDKTTITVYLFDRQKVTNKNRLFMLHRLLLKRNLAYRSLKSFSLANKISNKIIYNALRFHKPKRFFNPRKKDIYSKKQMYKYRIRPLLIKKNILSLIIRKKSHLKSLFFFYFMKWALSIFKIEVSLKNKLDFIKDNKTALNFILGFRPDLDKKLKNELTVTKNEEKVILNLISDKKWSVYKLKKINILLLQLFLKELTRITPEKDKTIDLETLYIKFKSKYHKIFFKKYLKKEILTLNFLTRYTFNKRKPVPFLSGLKSFISKVYSKKVELNLVNLKYLHMSIDNFSQAITTKLRKKTGRLLRVLKKSLKLVKKPRKFSARLALSKLVTSKPTDMWKNNIKNVLNSLKYKWVTGIRLEAKGRLTRRFTASRAVYKFKYKGNLRNLEHLYYTNYKEKSPSIFMLRNQFRPNTQHSYTFSNKRIGSFGVKGWISSV